MKTLIGTLVALATLAACGGGASSSSPLPVASNMPVAITPYSIQISYRGGMEPNGSTTQVVARGPQSNATATPLPIMLVAPDSTAPQARFGQSETGAEVSASVSPAPSPALASPSTWSQGLGTTIDLQTPAPMPSASPNLLQSIVTVPQVGAGATTLTVIVPAPVNATQSIPVFVYARLTLWCPHVNPATEQVPSEVVQGVSFDAQGNATPESSPASSDVYLDGPNCYGAFNNTGESAATLHFPYGAVTIATNNFSTNPFNSLTASQWTDSMTAIPAGFAQFSNAYIFKTSTGAIVKFEPTVFVLDAEIATGGTTNSEGIESGGYAVSGVSPDGF